MTRILGVETSCDETGIALYEGGRGLLAHALHSQVDIHAAFGGVVPELASRDHVRQVSSVVARVFEEAAIDPGSLNLSYARVDTGLR